MLPHLPGLNSPLAGGPVQVPPPPSLRLPLNPRNVQLDTSVRGLKSLGETAAQKSGLRYERHILARLKNIFEATIYLSPRISFEDDNGPGTAVPDAIIRQSHTIVIEIKSQHMPEAWWQLRKKYEPLVRKLFPEDQILLLEICSQLDAAQPFPEHYTYVEDLVRWVDGAKDGELGVFQWKL